MQLQNYHQLYITQICRDVVSVNQLAARLTGRNLPLSHFNLKSLEEITTRARLLEMSVNDRARELDQIINDHGAAQQHFLTDAVEQPWERAVTANKLPCYINRTTESVHYLSPKYTEIINSLVHFNFVRYSAYRTAMKLKALQSAFGLDQVTVDILASAFENHGLGPNARARQSVVKIDEKGEGAAAASTSNGKSETTKGTTAPQKVAKIFDMNINPETGELIPYELRQMGVSEMISCLNEIFKAVNAAANNNINSAAIGSEITSGVGSTSSSAASSSQPGTSKAASSKRSNGAGGKDSAIDSPGTGSNNINNSINVPLSVDLCLNFMLSLFDG